MRRLTTAGLLVFVLLAGLLPAASVLAAAASSVVLSGPTSIDVGQDAVLTATITAPAGYEADGATLDFVEAGGATGCTGVPVDTSGTTCTVSGLAVGTYHYTATYSGNPATDGSTSSDVQLDVIALPPPDPAPSSTALSGPGSIVVGTGAILTATVTAPAGYDGAGALIDFTAVSGGGPQCLDVPVSTTGTTCDLGVLAIGTYEYEASYSGNPTTEASTSSRVTITVTAVPDTTLDASGVKRDYATFYPVKDSYRDTLTLSGVRGESIAVTIRIYASSGRRVTTQAIASGSGAYSYRWSGRDSHGSILAAGRYRIVQSLKDAAGNTLVVTLYSTLSHKKLVTKTSYVTKLGKSFSAQSGPVIVSTSKGYAKLDARSVVKNVGYQFTIPSATRYRSISFQIYAKGPKTSPASAIGMQDFAVVVPDCSYSSAWNISCFDRIKTIGGSGTRWYSTSGSVTANRSGTKVRGVVSAADGITYVYKVRVKVVYQVLR